MRWLVSGARSGRAKACPRLLKGGGYGLELRPSDGSSRLACSRVSGRPISMKYPLKALPATLPSLARAGNTSDSIEQGVLEI